MRPLAPPRHFAGALRGRGSEGQGVEPRLFANDALVQRGPISVEVVGKGPDVALIPGLASSRETWEAFALRLRGRYRLHLAQVSGFAGGVAGDNAAGPVLIPAAEDFETDLGARLSAIRAPVVLLHPDDVPAGPPPGMMDKVYPAAYATAPTVRTGGVGHIGV